MALEHDPLTKQFHAHGSGERVVLALGEGRFQPWEIKAGIESGDRVEVLEGLEEGDTVVVSSQFLLDSQASIKASLGRMEPSEGSGTFTNQ